jgi:hypothetical protein
VFILKIYRDRRTKALPHSRKPKVEYDQAERNRIETPKISANNTQEHTFIKATQEHFTRFEIIWSKQAEQMSTLRNLNTALNKLVK